MFRWEIDESRSITKFRRGPVYSIGWLFSLAFCFWSARATTTHHFWFAISPGAQNSKTPKTMRVRGLWSVVSAQLWRGADCFLQQRRSMV
jgi:hypothetical protein